MIIETWLHQDINEPVKVNYLNGNLFTNNENGNRINVILTSNGQAVSVSGTVSGYVVTADGSTVPCTGSESGNRASILIPAAAYQPGPIFITVFVTDGTQVTTIGAVSSTVLSSRTNAQVDPGSVVTDWTQTINAAMQAVQTAAANMSSIIAVPYASITFPVPLGKYTVYNDNLYRCITPIASSEAFTAAHWAQVRLGDDVSDLKNAISNSPFNGIEFVVPVGTEHSSTKDKLYVNIKTGDKYRVVRSGGGTLYAFYSDGTSEYVDDKGIASKDIIAFGIYRNNTSGTSPLTIRMTLAFNPMGADIFDDIVRVKEMEASIEVIKNSIYSLDELAPSATSSGWRLEESSGLCYEASGYKLVKYQVTAGDELKVESDDRFQFQTSASVPANPPINRVGNITYQTGTYILKVPEMATYLIVSTPTNGTAKVYKYKISAINDELHEAEFRIIDGNYTQQTETGYAIKNNVSNGSIVNIDSPVQISNTASIVVRNVYAGMAFRVWGSGQYNYLLWSWLDKDKKLISKADAWDASGSDGLTITAPTNAKYLVCDSTTDYQYGFKVKCLCSVTNLYNDIDGIADQRDAIESNLIDNNTATFVFFSDIHGSSKNFERIIEYAEGRSVNAILNGGDTVINYLNDDSHPLTWYTDGVAGSTVDILSAVGNHDVWSGAYWTKAQPVDIYNAFIKPTVDNFSNIIQPAGASSSGLCYYYKDYSSVRVIILNAMAGAESVSFWDSAEANWLTSVLTDAIANSKHVLIVNHAPFLKSIAVRDEKNHWNSYVDYRTSATYDDIYTESPAVQIVKDFIDGGGKFIGWLTGHIHADSFLTAEGFTKQAMFNIATANCGIHSDGKTYTNSTSKYYDCFNHIAVDTTRGLVKMIRVGWNTDYSIKVRERLCYDYIKGKLLTDN